jgi:hypothetical protein
MSVRVALVSVLAAATLTIGWQRAAPLTALPIPKAGPLAQPKSIQGPGDQGAGAPARARPDEPTPARHGESIRPEAAPAPAAPALMLTLDVARTRNLRTSCWRWPTSPGSVGSRPSARGPCRLPGGRCPPPPLRGDYRTGPSNDCGVSPCGLPTAPGRALTTAWRHDIHPAFNCVVNPGGVRLDRAKRPVPPTLSGA